MSIFGPSKKELRSQLYWIREKRSAELTAAAARERRLSKSLRTLVVLVPESARYIKVDVWGAALLDARLKADADAIRAARQTQRGLDLLKDIPNDSEED